MKCSKCKLPSWTLKKGLCPFCQQTINYPCRYFGPCAKGACHGNG